MPLSEIEIFRGSSKVDLDWLVVTLQASYWGGYLSYDQVIQSIEGCPCFSACLKNCEQIGFARVITDYVTVAMIHDVIVDEKWRRQGVGSMLMRELVNDRIISKLLCILECRPENVGFYEKFGFRLSEHGGRFMKRNPT
jgi:ribosomal protein S18 acetylase RimI-like enzyme